MFYLNAKNLILIPLALILLLVAAVGLSILPLHSLGMGWEAAPFYGPDFYLHSLAWRLLILSLFFLGLSFIAIWQSELRYDFSFFSLFSLSVFIFLALGLLFFYAGIADFTDSRLASSRAYAYVLGDRNAAWKHPELGLLSGQIAASQKADELRLIGFDQHVWTLDIYKLSPESRSSLNTGKNYRLIGQDKGDKRFEVEKYYDYGN